MVARTTIEGFEIVRKTGKIGEGAEDPRGALVGARRGADPVRDWEPWQKKNEPANIRTGAFG